MLLKEKINYKLNVLFKIARTFNDHNIIWAVGGSTLLYFKELVDDFNDIDIMVKEEQIKEVKQLLLNLGKLKPQNLNVDYRTKYFLEFNINGIDVDVIAGFIIVKDSRNYYFPLKEDDILEFIEINNEKIPLHSLKEWKKYYELMGRVERVELITID